MVTNSSINSVSINGTVPRAVADVVAPESRKVKAISERSEASLASQGPIVLEISSSVAAPDAVKQQESRQQSEEGSNNSKPDGSPENSKHLAERLEKALNDAKGNQLRFNVLSKDPGLSSFHFQVIDRSTGQVVREFPPEAVKAMAENGKIDEGSGLLVDQTA